MQGKDPFLALLGLFILSTTFFFCGERAVTSPPPIALENPAEILPPAPKIIEFPPSPLPLPPVSAPAVLKKEIDELLIGNTVAFRINSATLPPEGKPVLNSMAVILYEDPTMVLEASGHTDNLGPESPNRMLSEQRAKAVVGSLFSKGIMMSGNWTCWLWTVVGAGLLGWGIKGMVLGPVMDDKRREVERLTSKVAMLTNQPPEVRTVEKRVEVPVERVVVKRIEVPVEKVVDRPVDNPEQLARIKALEGEVAVITDLRAQMAALRAASVRTSEKIVEKRIETPTEKNGEVPIDQVNGHAVDLNRAEAVGQPDEGQAATESPDDLKHIYGVGPALERFLHKRGVFWFSQVATWSQADIDKFEFLLPNFGGRIQRENWVRSAKVEYYKKYKKWLGDGEPPSDSLDVRAQMAELRDASVRAREKVVEKQIETPAEKIVVKDGEVPVEQISEHMGNLDHAGAAGQSDEGQAVGEPPDDLKHIYGVGPALERFLHKRGVFWFSQVATWSQADIDKFEFLLPNFGGRIQRENWVRSAKVEYYKKYKKWLGNDEPPSTTSEIH